MREGGGEKGRERGREGARGGKEETEGAPPCQGYRYGLWNAPGGTC